MRKNIFESEEEAREKTDEFSLKVLSSCLKKELVIELDNYIQSERNAVDKEK